MSDPYGPGFEQEHTMPNDGPSADPERPKWMMAVAILFMVTAPIVGQILIQKPDFVGTVYRFSWTMYSR